MESLWRKLVFLALNESSEHTIEMAILILISEFSTGFRMLPPVGIVIFSVR
jgi:hypothetical protein